MLGEVRKGEKRMKDDNAKERLRKYSGEVSQRLLRTSIRYLECI